VRPDHALAYAGACFPWFEDGVPDMAQKKSDREKIEEENQ